MLPHRTFLGPHAPSADGGQGAVLDEAVGRVHEGKKPHTVILDAQGEADHAEAVSRANHQGVLGTQGPHQRIVEKPKPKVEAPGILPVSEGLGEMENVFQQGVAQTEAIHHLAPFSVIDS